MLKLNTQNPTTQSVAVIGLIIMLFSVLVGCDSSPSKEIVGLIEAASNGNADGIETFIQQGVDVNSKDKSGNTALHHVSNVTEEKMSKLSKLSMETSKDRTFATFGLVKFEGFDQCAKLPIKHGADVNIKNNEGKTPLALAIIADNAGVVSILKSHGAH